MTKQDYLTALRTELEKNKIPNVQEILSDYEEHFAHGLNKGKTEAVISEGLGNPVTIAKAFETEKMIASLQSPENPFPWGLAFNVIGRLLVLAPFNFIVLFIPGAILGSLVFAGWTVALTLGGASLAILSGLPKIALASFSAWIWLAGISTSFGLLGLAALGCLCMFFMTKFLLLGLISYLQWNLKFILQR